MEAAALKPLTWAVFDLNYDILCLCCFPLVKLTCQLRRAGKQVVERKTFGLNYFSFVKCSD